MRLERLEISGFKSFSDRAELAFDQGVTAIVGPNGCGKSNVADALTWVHQSVPITVGPAPFEVRRREIVTLALVGVYVLGIAWALFRLALGLSRAWRRPGSSMSPATRPRSRET